MENPIQILVVGTNQPIMETIARLIDKDGRWKATMALSADEAYQCCKTCSFSLALIGAGLAELEELQLKERLRQLQPGLAVVKHYGGGSGLLYAEIFQGLAGLE